jgi:tRNA pseudouridine55 synthase
MDGVLVIDKPVGPTSHDIVARARRALGESRIGHTGTLDPAASGVLPLVIGKATRLARFLSAGDKCYDALIRLGFSTDTGDALGIPLGGEYAGPLPTRESIDAALDLFRGHFLQQPPVYSAKKIDGHPSHRLARAAARQAPDTAPGAGQPPLSGGSSKAPLPVGVTTHAVVLMGMKASEVALHVECSAGFYVRSLAHDLGERLGTGAHLVGLRRTRAGDYGLGEALPIDVVERDRDAAIARIVPLDSMLSRLSPVILTPEGAKRARHGRDLGPHDILSNPIPADVAGHGETPARSEIDGWVRLLGPEGELVGLAQSAGSPGLLHPSVVLI